MWWHQDGGLVCTGVKGSGHAAKQDRLYNCYCVLRSKLSCKTLYNQKVARSNNIIDLFKTNFASCGNGWLTLVIKNELNVTMTMERLHFKVKGAGHYLFLTAALLACLTSRRLEGDPDAKMSKVGCFHAQRRGAIVWCNSINVAFSLHSCTQRSH